MSEVPFSGCLSALNLLSDALGEHTLDWSAKEDFETITYWNENFNRERATSVPLEVFQTLQATFKGALRFKLSLGGFDVLDLNEPITQIALDNLKLSTQQAPSITFNFEIDKAVLISLQWPDLPTIAHPILFIHPKIFENYISNADLSKLETKLWSQDPAKKVVILIPEKEILIDGFYLKVIGGNHLLTLDDTYLANLNEIQTANGLFDRSQNSVRWQTDFVKSLTPLHFAFKIIAGVEEQITRVLLIHRANIILLYLADRTIIRQKQTISIFTTTQQSIEIHSFDPKSFTNVNLTEGAANLLEIFLWAYDSKWNFLDRIPLVQIGIVQALIASNPIYRQTLLIENTKPIYENLQWHWKAFIEGKINEYTRQENEVEEFVSDSVRSFTDQINLLVKNLSDTVLAAVGALIGSLIAALFSDKFNDSIFQIGLWIYAGYVFFFPGLFNMTNQWGHYKAFVEDFEFRKQRYEVRLYEEKVKEIIGDQFNRGKRRFKSAFWTITCTYALIMFIAIAVSFILPPIIHKSINAMQITETTSVVATSTIIGTFDINPTLQITTGTTGITPMSITPSP